MYEESDAASGRGRLHGPIFEAWLRAERAHGFISLAELNAGGRALPLSKQYLYGAYFYEFLARRYGAQAPRAFVERYSGNVVPRLRSNPVRITGKKMDELWKEFLVDLARRWMPRPPRSRHGPTPKYWASGSPGRCSTSRPSPPCLMARCWPCSMLAWVARSWCAWLPMAGSSPSPA